MPGDGSREDFPYVLFEIKIDRNTWTLTAIAKISRREIDNVPVINDTAGEMTCPNLRGGKAWRKNETTLSSSDNNWMQ